MLSLLSIVGMAERKKERMKEIVVSILCKRKLVNKNNNDHCQCFVTPGQ